METNLDRLVRRVQRTLEATTGHPASLSCPAVIKNAPRSLVVRCRVESALGLHSIVVRRIEGDPARGFTDWAGLAFLSELPEARGLVPRFLVGDADARWFATEDLGRGSNLGDLLALRDPEGARSALQALAVAMARLHAATLTKYDAYEAIRRALPAADGLGRFREAEAWLAGYRKLLAWFAAVDRMPPAGLRDSMDRVARGYREPDEFLSFTHGDPAPTNNHFSRGRAHLLDFEYGGYRHALYDLTAWNVLCPLPSAWLHDMRRSFRKELANALPVARDEARFKEAWAFLCAYRALAVLTWLPPDILVRDRPWADGWSMRQAMLVALSRLREASVSVAPLRPIREGAGALLEVLRPRWAEHVDVEDLLPRWTATQKP